MRTSQSFAAEAIRSADSRRSVSSLELAADATADNLHCQLPLISPGSPLIIQFVDSFPEYWIESDSRGGKDLTQSHFRPSAQSPSPYYFFEDLGEERLVKCTLDSTLSRCQSFPQSIPSECAVEPEGKIIKDRVDPDLGGHHSHPQIPSDLYLRESLEGQFEHQGGDGTTESVPSVYPNDPHSQEPAELLSENLSSSNTLNLQKSSPHQLQNNQEEGVLRSGLGFAPSAPIFSGNKTKNDHLSRKSLRATNLSTVPESSSLSENQESLQSLKLPTKHFPDSSHQRESGSVPAVRSYSLSGHPPVSCTLATSFLMSKNVLIGGSLTDTCIVVE